MAVAAMSVVYVLTNPIPEDGENATVDQIRRRNKWDNDDYVCRGLILKVMEQYIELLGILGRFTQHKMNMDEAIQVSCIIDKLSHSWKDFKHTLKHKKEELTLVELNIVNDIGKSAFMSTSKLNDSILWHARLGHVHFKRMQDMSKDGLISAFDMDTEKCKTCMLNKITKKPFQNVKRETEVLELIHSDLCDLHATPSLGNKKYFVTFIDDASRFCYVYLLHTKDEALDKFKVFKTEVELQQGSQIKRFRTDRGGEYMDTLYFQSVGIIHETTAPYTPQQNGISERKNRVLKEMVNSMLSYSGLSQGFWVKLFVRLPDPKLKTLGERGIECIFVGYAEHSKAFRFYVIVPNDSVSINSIIESRDAIFDENRFSSVPRPSLNFVTFIDDASRTESKVLGVVVRLPDPKLKTLGERGIECIFVGYVEHSKAFRFYVIEPNESVLINSIIKSKDAIFDENRFSSVHRPSQKSLVKGTEDSGGLVVPEKVTEEVVQQPEPELRKSKRNRTPKDFGPEFQLYLIKGTRDEVSDQHSYCFNVEDDPKTFDEAMKSQDMDLQKKLKVDGTIEKFKARLVIQGFRQKLGIDYFDTYALVARISTIRLLIAMASIHNIIIHQMDVKTAFLNDELDEEVDLTKEFLSSRFSMKDMGEADVILGIRIKHESNRIAISQSRYIEKVLKKFNYFDCTPVSTLMDTSEKLMPNIGQVVSQLKYSRVIGYLMYVMTCTRPDIAFAVGKLSRYTSNQALATTGKKAEWLRNLILKIPLWSKPITPISIRCDSAATLAKAKCTMFVRSQQNLADHLTKGLAIDLVIKSTEGMGLKRQAIKKEPPIVNVEGFAAFRDMDFGSYNIYELDMDTCCIMEEVDVEFGCHLEVKVEIEHEAY
ncbi:zinc finger, CCHC-type containing protein [Tanacetum coccineum]